MSVFAKLSAAMVFIVVWASAAHAGDPRCSKPPYGGSPDRYRAILETHGNKSDGVATALEAICNMKFSGTDRSALLKLGFTDQEIDRLDTSTLAVDMLNGVKSRPGSN